MCWQKDPEGSYVPAKWSVLHLLLFLNRWLTGRCNVTHGLHTAWSGVSGSLWDPGVTADVSLDEQHGLLTVMVSFKTGQYSDRYRVSVQSHGLSYSRNVSKVSELLVRLRNQTLFLTMTVWLFHISLNKQNNKTSLNMTFELELWQLSQCEVLIKVSSALTIECPVAGSEFSFSSRITLLFPKGPAVFHTM